jgi:hypothetical protein
VLRLLVPKYPGVRFVCVDKVDYCASVKNMDSGMIFGVWVEWGQRDERRVGGCKSENKGVVTIRFPQPKFVQC